MFFAKLPADGSLMGTGTVSGIDITYAESSMNSVTGTLVYTSGVPDGPMSSVDPALPESESTLSTSPNIFTTPGTHSWRCPEGVTSICVVAVGGGGGGGLSNFDSSSGGGGGGLGWKNNIAVTPGQTYTVVVGAAGSITLAGGDSYFINTSTIAGFGGQPGTETQGLGTITGGTGGTYVGDGGGTGGTGGGTVKYANQPGAGGGAGGYSGNGGIGAGSNQYYNGIGAGGPGFGGGGGGGASASFSPGAGAGGGVGLYGQGLSGVSSSPGQGGWGGSGGGFGTVRVATEGFRGGNYGGGGAGSASELSSSGGPGAVRIIYGDGLSFPDNAPPIVEMLPSSGTLTTPAPPVPTAGEFISIYSIGFNGSNILDIDHFVGDGYTTEFITKAKWSSSFTPLVYVDGVIETPDAFKTDNTYDSANRIAFRFVTAPVIGALINFIVVAGTEQTYAITKTEKLLTDGRFNVDPDTGLALTTSTYSLTYPVGKNLPNESNMIVKVNNSIVSGPISSYFKIENNKLNYKLDATKVLPYSTTISNIKVYVGAVKLTQGPDYTVDASGITIKLNKISYATYAKQLLVVSVITDQGYAYDPTTNEITFSQVYQSPDSVEVISSYNHDTLDIQRTEITVSTNLSYTENTVEYYSYRSLTSGLVPLDRAVIDDNYVWVLHNNQLLVPSIEYKLLPDKKSIQLAFIPAESDTITLTTFSSNVMIPSIAYMQFKDMLNRVHYKRLNASKRTKLLADLNYNAVSITVEDAANFDVPNISLNKPGIVEIYGERIEYFSITVNPSGVWTLGRLRRGTLGTGTPLVHKAGTFVQDIGYSETVPYIEKSVVEQVVSDGTNIVPLKFTPGGFTAAWTYKGTALTVQQAANLAQNAVEVFVGGYSSAGEWTANTSYHVGDIVTVGSYTYKSTLDHIAGATFESTVTTVTYNADGTIASTVATKVNPNWEFFIGNIRLKKQPYKVHNVNQAEYSPAGDMQMDSEFTVDGTTNQILLASSVPIGTRVTVVKRVGTEWDSTVNILYDESKIARFLRAEPGIWYEESNPNRT
jgi:hypothetical protein